MKKLIYSISLGLFLTSTACQSINNGVKVISKCCKAVSAVKNGCTVDGKDKEIENSNGSSILPINSWDGKMLIW